MGMIGECTLNICGDELDFAYIEKTLELKATRVIEKGQEITLGRCAPSSIWSYSKSINEEMPFETVVKEFLKELSIQKSVLQEVSLRYETKIKCYIRSESGQLGYEIDKEAVKLLNDIGLPIEFHILSFGMAE